MTKRNPTVDEISEALSIAGTEVNNLRALLAQAKAERDRLMVQARDAGLTYARIGELTVISSTGSVQESINRTRAALAEQQRTHKPAATTRARRTATAKATKRTRPAK